MTDRPDLRAILRSDYVIRYHANPDLARYGDTNGHHQAMVAQIIFALHPNPSLLLIHAALHHDTGEMDLGDFAGPAKASNPDLCDLLEIAEGRNRTRMGCNYVLTSSDAEWLTFADRLAAYFHVKHVSPRHLNNDGWHAARDWLRDTGLRLGLDNVPWETGI